MPMPHIHASSSPATLRWRDMYLQLALPAGRCFDRDVHLSIMRQMHAHICVHGIAARCDGPGGDLFFAMRYYQPLLRDMFPSLTST